MKYSKAVTVPNKIATLVNSGFLQIFLRNNFDTNFTFKLGLGMIIDSIIIVEITLWHGCSPVNLKHIFRTHLGDCSLTELTWKDARDSLIVWLFG